MAHATASVATITTAKAGFLAGSAASASTESLNDPGSYQSYHSYAPPTVAAALPAEVAASVLATYTATVEVTMSLSGLTKTNFEKPAVQIRSRRAWPGLTGSPRTKSLSPTL